MDAPNVKFYSEDPDVQAPVYATPGAAAMDLCASEDRQMHPGEVAVIKTGLYAAVPEGWQLNIYSRSGLAAKGMFVANAPGIVDSDYRGEIGVILKNDTGGVAHINKGARIAQCQLNPVHCFTFQRVVSKDELGATERGTGGFGSTGATEQIAKLPKMLEALGHGNVLDALEHAVRMRDALRILSCWLGPIKAHVVRDFAYRALRITPNA